MLHNSQAVPEVYKAPLPTSIECAVQGRIALDHAVIELHQYLFRQPQRAIFRSPRSFLDLALSPRPGNPRGGYVDAPGSTQKPLGDIIFIPAGHRLQTEWGAGHQQSICCGFDGGRPDDVEGLFALTELDACLDIRSAFVREAMLRLAREIKAPGFGSDLLVGALWIEIAVELGRYLRRIREAPQTAHGRLGIAQMRLIDELIDRPGILPGLAELAGHCGISTRHFSRLFRATTGTTLSGHAAARRIDRARLLLATPRPAIKEVAWQCGFETAAAFSAAFRRAVGVTPKEYRRTVLH